MSIVILLFFQCCSIQLLRVNYDFGPGILSQFGFGPYKIKNLDFFSPLFPPHLSVIMNVLKWHTDLEYIIILCLY